MEESPGSRISTNIHLDEESFPLLQQTSPDGLFRGSVDPFGTVGSRLGYYVDKKPSATALLICLSCSFYAGVLDWLYVLPPAAGQWYERLERPHWCPPDWSLLPLYTLFRTLQALSAWLVWLDGHEFDTQTLRVLGLFALQLVLSVLWFGLLFSANLLGLACIISCCLWCAVLGTVIMVLQMKREHSLAAGWVLSPYVLWAAYIVTLNFVIMEMNR